MRKSICNDGYMKKHTAKSTQIFSALLKEKGQEVGGTSLSEINCLMA